MNCMIRSSDRLMMIEVVFVVLAVTGTSRRHESDLLGHSRCLTIGMTAIVNELRNNTTGAFPSALCIPNETMKNSSAPTSSAKTLVNSSAEGIMLDHRGSSYNHVQVAGYVDCTVVR